MSKIIIAIPRGRIIKELKKILMKTTFAPEEEMFDDKSRKLTFLSKNKDVNFIKVRAFDACTFVAFGAAQIGIAGEDVIKETYDKELDHRERMSMLLKITYDLANLSDRHHMRIQNIISDVLVHNQTNFLSPKVHRINNLLNRLEYYA